VVNPSAAPAALEARAWAALESVADPEIPVLSITDLGIVRYVRATGAASVEVGLTPTYSGCPATEVIRAACAEALKAAGCAARLVEVLAPAWSSACLSARGRERLASYGIAPPAVPVGRVRALLQSADSAPIACPHCASLHTACVSEFGSTPCKALHRCSDCREPFEYFKCI
jgi:ring-1,2-phenylacetyl-CoA epoxidase subunit PaaD